MREIEVKLRIENLEALAKAVRERGCQLSEPIAQHDVVYAIGDRAADFWIQAKEGDTVLRIRRAGGKAEFNLKKQCTSELDNIEYETEVADPDVLHKILVAIGYKPEVEVKKMRRKGKLGEYEICLDQVEELGDFAELEKLAPDDADPKVVLEELLHTMESLGVPRKNLEEKGYDTQLFLLHHRK
jgi:adenylate cyclase, class 2